MNELAAISFAFAFIALSVVMILLISYAIYMVVRVYNKLDLLSGPGIGLKVEK